MSLLLLALLPWQSAAAQDHTLSTWLASAVQVEHGARWRTGALQELRYGLTAGEVETVNTSLTAGYDAGRHLDLGAHYRLDLVGWDTGVLSTRHRLGLDASVPATVGRVTVSLRQRLQPELDPTGPVSAELVLRTRARADVELGAVAPYVAIEPYLRAVAGEVGRLRLDVGLGVPIPEGRLDLSYRLDEPVAAAGVAPHRHILTLAGSWSVRPGPEPVQTATTDE